VSAALLLGATMIFVIEIANTSTATTAIALRMNASSREPPEDSIVNPITQKVRQPAASALNKGHNRIV